MREIEFRAKMPNGDWITGTGIDKKVFVYSDDKITEYYLWTGIQWVKVIKETIGEYTWLKDINGKKIFEGDIDKSGLIVSYCGGQESSLGMNAGWYLQRGNFESWVELESRSNYNGDNYEIIGNIYDNPELLMMG